MSNSLWPHGLQHARLPCPSLSPGVCLDSYPLSQWCYLVISSSATLFCPLSFLASRSFPVSQLFASGGQSIGASALALILPVNSQGWFPLGLTGLISLLSSGFSRVFSSTAVRKHGFWCSSFFMVQLSHLYMTTEKTIALTIRTLFAKWYLPFNTLSRFVIAFFPRSEHLFISWL